MNELEILATQPILPHIATVGNFISVCIAVSAIGMLYHNFRELRIQNQEYQKQEEMRAHDEKEPRVY